MDMDTERLISGTSLDGETIGEDHIGDICHDLEIDIRRLEKAMELVEAELNPDEDCWYPEAWVMIGPAELAYPATTEEMEALHPRLRGLMGDLDEEPRSGTPTPEELSWLIVELDPAVVVFDKLGGDRWRGRRTDLLYRERSELPDAVGNPQGVVCVRGVDRETAARRIEAMCTRSIFRSGVEAKRCCKAAGGAQGAGWPLGPGAKALNVSG